MEHRDYLQMEEEKRRRARIVRVGVEGPKVRWVSKGEEVKYKFPASSTAKSVYGYPTGTGVGGHGYTSGYYSYQNFQASIENGSSNGLSSCFNAPPPTPSSPITLSASTTILTPTTLTLTPTSLSSHYPNSSQQRVPLYYSPAPPMVERVEKMCKNYVIHEVPPPPQSHNSLLTHSTYKPSWQDTMSALFGEDVNWAELRVWTGRGRPLGMSFCLNVLISE